MRGSRALLGTAIVLTGLISGFFYAYACSVMIGLRETSDRVFVESMQAINAMVRNFWFAPSFFGSLIFGVVCAVAACFGGWRNRWWIVSAALLYGAAFVATMAVNVPMNEALAAAGSVGQIEDLARVRADYEGPWVAWNIVRTLLSACAMAALVCAAFVGAEKTDRTVGRTSAG